MLEVLGFRQPSPKLLSSQRSTSNKMATFVPFAWEKPQPTQWRYSSSVSGLGAQYGGFRMQQQVPPPVPSPSQGRCSPRPTQFCPPLTFLKLSLCLKDFSIGLW